MLIIIGIGLVSLVLILAALAATSSNSHIKIIEPAQPNYLEISKPLRRHRNAEGWLIIEEGKGEGHYY